MTNHLRGNWMLFMVLSIYGAYIVAGIVIPKPYIFHAVALVLTLSGAYMFLKYAGKSWDILWNHERGQYGAHYAVVGTCELGLGLFYSGMYRFIWDYYDQPDIWNATWYSSLGGFMIAKGAFRVSMSPNEKFFGLATPNQVVKTIVTGIAIFVAFFAGRHFN